MNEFIRGAATLTKFTEAIEAGFRELNVLDNPGLELVQIHASPLSLQEDLVLLQAAQISDSKKIFLIHRPDELLLHSKLMEYFIQNPRALIIVLGDLVLNLEFWKARREFIHVIPHPYLDVNLPTRHQNKFVIGSFTAWGEMRKLEHFFTLTEEISQSSLVDKVHFLIGGTINGQSLKRADMPEQINLSEDFFIPHFNVQLYHLNGKKRLGESSGSLHRGISVPIIFEANGIERTEGIRVIKIESDDDLKMIDFKKAAQAVNQLMSDMDQHINFNRERALLNLPQHFARRILAILDVKVK